MTFDTQTLEKRAGAAACVAALAQLIKAANTPQIDSSDALEYVTKAITESAELLKIFGPLTPQQEGAILCLAEYIHFSETTGTPNLDTWTPFSTDSKEDVDSFIAKMNANE